MSKLVLFYSILTWCAATTSLCKAYNDLGEPLFLTNFIRAGNISEARYRARVHHPEINILSYAGYLTVNEKYNSNLFLWYFPAKVNNKNAPVVLWLEGGPGAPSTFALFVENGPYILSPTQRLIENKHSWHIHHHLIYIDNPVGTGYSFTDSHDGYAKNEKDVGRDLLVALQQFFVMFPELQENEFFASGESYAGKYVPAIGYAILQDSFRKEVDPMKPKINLKGLAIGNGFVDPVNQLKYSDYLYQLGLVDSNGQDELRRFENRIIDCIKRKDFECAFILFDQLIDGVFTPNTLVANLTGYRNNFNFLITKAEDYSLYDEYMQTSEIRRAIHVGNNTFLDVIGLSKVIDSMRLDFMDTVAPWVAELLSHYPIYMYNGQLDIVCAYPLTDNFLKNLKFSGAEEFRTAKRNIWHVGNDIAGYVKHAGNLTQILVRNAGHLTAADQPERILDMLLHLTHHKRFSKD